MLLQGYEALTEQPVAHESDVDFVCLTDDPTLASNTWGIRHVRPLFGQDAPRSQRHLKIRAHAAVPDYDVSIYIDNSVLLKQTPERLLADLLPAGTLFAGMAHSFRSSISAEFEEVVRLGLETHDRCAEQEEHYRLDDPVSLALRPIKGGLLLRRHHDPLVVAAMEAWAAHVLRYARRDQLSLWFCLREAGLEPLIHELDNFESDYHRWPVSVGRAERARLQSSNEELCAARAQIARLESELQAMRDSRSWRWTRTPRRVSGVWRGRYSASNASTSPESSHAAASR